MNSLSSTPSVSELRPLWARRMGLLVIALLFPSYLYYHFAIGNRVIPPVLGGFFAAASAGLLPVALILVLRDAVADLATQYFWFVLLFLGFGAAWAAIHFVFGAGYQKAHVVYSVYHLMLMLVVFAGARSLDLESPETQRILLLLWLGMAAVVLYHTDRNLVIPLLVQKQEGTEMGTYQGIARSVLVASIFLLATLRGLAIVPFVLTTLVVLFAIGARSQFAGFIIVAAWMAPIWFFEKKRVLIAAAVGVTLVIGSVLSGVVSQQSRMFELFDITRSTSYVARSNLNDIALNTIIDNPLIGDFGSDAGGDYAHNALSAWVAYGAIGFVLYVGLVLTPFIDTFKRLALEDRPPDVLLRATFAFSVYHITMITMAKAVIDPVVAVGWGLYSTLALRDQIGGKALSFRYPMTALDCRAEETAGQQATSGPEGRETSPSSRPSAAEQPQSS